MPVIQDPFAETKRKFKENDLREIWQTMKAQAINQVQRDLGKAAATNLAAQFNKGLGPLLTQWADEASRLPKVSKEDLDDTKSQIERVIDSYTTGLGDPRLNIKGSRAYIVLTGTLKGIREELDRQVGWYHDVGLL